MAVRRIPIAVILVPKNPMRHCVVVIRDIRVIRVLFRDCAAWREHGSHR